MPEESGDTKILNMRVNNKQFLKGTGESLRALDILNKGIDKFVNNNNGVKEMGGAVDVVKNKFSALQIAGVTALATITNKAVNAGLSLIKSLTITPVLQGFHEYEKLLTSTQTIVANTGVKVATANKYLQQLNTYSDKTIYNFGQMAENVGRFTAAVDPKKIKLPTVVAAIKGLSNVAALAGANNEQLGRAMYQMSQAMGQASIRLMDWNSLAQAGMGSVQLQQAFQETSKTVGDHGKAMQAAIKEHGTFRDSLREGWLTLPIFNKTLKVMAGTLLDTKTPLKELQDKGFTPMAIKAIRAGKYVAYSTKQLKAMGYTAPGVAEQLNKLSTNAIKSATEIKTFTQLMGVVRESIASGIGRVFMALLGDYDEAKKMWTDVGDVVTTAIGRMFTAVEMIMDQWEELGGFEKLWGGVLNVVKALGNVLAPFGMAFKALFPGIENTGELLFKMTNGFYKFSVWLEKATRGAAAFAPVLAGLGAAFMFPINLAKRFGETISNIFADENFAGILQKIADALGSVGDALAKAFGDEAADKIEHGFNVALLGGIFLAIKGFTDRLNTYFTGGIFGKNGGLANITASMRGLTGALQQMQTLIRAKTLKEIAIAVALLAGAMLILAMVNPKRLETSLKAMTIVFAELLLATGILIKLAGAAGFVKIPIIAASLVMFSGAILILSMAVKILSTMSWDEIVRGLTALGGILAGILVFTKLLQGSAIKIMAVGLAMIPFAIGISILAGALKLLATMSWEDIQKGLASLAGMLVAVAVGMRLMPLSLPVTAAGLVMVGVAINLIARALQTISAMNAEELKKGILAIAMAIGAIGLATMLLPKSLPFTAAGLVMVSIALDGIASTIKSLGGMKPEVLKQGLLGLALGIAGLGLALHLFGVSGILGGVALNLVAMALVLLVPEIIALGQVDWKILATGIGALAGLLLVMGVAGAVAGPAILMVAAGILLLGTGIALAGAGVLAFGVGIWFLAKGIKMLVDLSHELVTSLVVVVQALISHIPAISQSLLMALVGVVQAIAAKMPEFVMAGVQIIMSILRGIQMIAPAIADTALKLLTTFIEEVVEHQDRLNNAAFDLIEGFLETLLDRLPDLIETGVDIVVALVEGIGDGAGEIVTAAGNTLIAFLEAIEDQAASLAERFVDVGQGIGIEIAKGVLLGITNDLPGPIRAGINKFFGISSKGKGKNNKADKNAQGTDYFRGGLSLVGELGPELVSMNRGAAVITNKNLVGFMRSVSRLTKAMMNSPKSISQNSSGGTLSLAVSADFKGDPKRNGAAFAADIARGLIGGLQANQPKVNQSMANMGNTMAQSFADILGIKSPSTVFQQFAGDVAKGFIRGLLINIANVKKAASAMGQAVIQGVAKTITDGQLKLEAVRARSTAYDAVIARLEAKASKTEDVEKKEELEKEIEELKKKAEQAKKVADAQAKAVEEQRAAADRWMEFKAADNARKSEMRKEDAAMAAEKASAAREEALRLKMEADILRRYDSKAAAILEAKAATVLKQATTYADLANKFSKEAYEYAQKVQQEVAAELAQQFQQVTAQDVSNAQAAVEAYLRAVADAQDAAEAEGIARSVTFEQNLYSPEPISAAEAYRNGKSLVSLAERKLVNAP